MRHVTVQLTAPDTSPIAAYRLVSDFRRYPELTEDVTEVTLRPRGEDGSQISEWTVLFRNGMMCWTERDEFSEEDLRISFEQLSGDFETFYGSWRCAPSPGGDGAVVTFEASFDLGIPTLADILDPVAESTLRDVIDRTLRGLLGTVARTEGRGQEQGDGEGEGGPGPVRVTGGAGAGRAGTQPVGAGRA